MTQLYRRILVPLDGSDLAELALGPARTLARKGGGELHLLSSASPLPSIRPATADQEEVRGWFAEERARVEAYLEGLEARLRKEDPELVVRTHVRVGRPAPMIVRRTNELDVDLVVMTTHGRGAVGRAWLGSVADAVLRQAPCPVLLLRPGDAGDPEPPVAFDSVLVTLDGSTPAERALAQAVRLTAAWKGRLALGSVIPTPHSVAVPYLDASPEAEAVRRAMESEFREYLERTAASLVERGMAVHTHVVRADEVSQGILELLKRTGAGILVMSTAGRGGMSRLLLGSVSSRMVRTSPVPVLVVPPGEGVAED